MELLELSAVCILAVLFEGVELSVGGHRNVTSVEAWLLLNLELSERKVIAASSGAHEDKIAVDRLDCVAIIVVVLSTARDGDKLRESQGAVGGELGVFHTDGVVQTSLLRAGCIPFRASILIITLWIWSHSVHKAVPRTASAEPHIPELVLSLSFEGRNGLAFLKSFHLSDAQTRIRAGSLVSDVGIIL